MSLTLLFSRTATRHCSGLRLGRTIPSLHPLSSSLSIYQWNSKRFYHPTGPPKESKVATFAAYAFKAYRTRAELLTAFTISTTYCSQAVKSLEGFREGNLILTVDLPALAHSDQLLGPGLVWLGSLLGALHHLRQLQRPGSPQDLQRHARWASFLLGIALAPLDLLPAVEAAMLTLAGPFLAILRMQKPSELPSYSAVHSFLTGLLLYGLLSGLGSLVLYLHHGLPSGLYLPRMDLLVCIGGMSLVNGYEGRGLVRRFEEGRRDNAGTALGYLMKLLGGYGIILLGGLGLVAILMVFWNFGKNSTTQDKKE